MTAYMPLVPSCPNDRAKLLEDAVVVGAGEEPLGVISPSAPETLPNRVLSSAQILRIPVMIAGTSLADETFRNEVWFVCSKLEGEGILEIGRGAGI